jgi:glutamate dehydrogenase
MLRIYIMARRLIEPSLRHVLKTNFYQPTKVALSFRLTPDFLPESEYPKKPFGMFFVIG